jgi:hypothetical protein
MAHLELDDRCLHVNLGLLDTFLSLHSSLKIPLANVESVELRPEMPFPRDVYADHFKGTYVPDRILAGVSRKEDGAVFCDVRHPENAIGLHLRGGHFRRVIFEVDGETPEQARDRIEARLGRTAAHHAPQ